ncbi:very short patch repair endonuclease [Caulobacter segnis]|uniref:Very short patch repair endonuclease n=2 Tax=Caulobacter segnis TaxID=88688 RepID=D5VEE1_CAUST|nr:very short patch repair endonuclease [Caulobacter segnis]ADG08964.1 DNA mismatch endonuclease Vsr [Caulobacter segnis ATCC 21756]AVQ00801.1 very short patch repair endonuclease [Caulobacter segnis]
MVDRLTEDRRSWLMSRVRSENTTPELRVRSIAHSMGLRFRLHRSDLPGKPDLVFPRHKVAIFVHGCFWHRHEGCRKASMPKSRQEFWGAKFEANIERDRRVTSQLRALGWNVETIWECETRDLKTISERLSRVFGLLKRRDK